MLKTILGKKINMGHVYIEDTRVPVTKIVAGPCVVTQIKTDEKDGYWSVQLGFEEKKIKNITKPEKGHLKGVIKGAFAPRFLAEVRLDQKSDLKVGDIVNVSSLIKKGDEVSVSGISKSKGFQGVVKRWGFSGGPRTHGQSDRLRAPGSIGQGTTPGRVHKGKKMAGRMGGDRITVKGLVVVDTKEDTNEILVSGSVPGNPGGLLILTKTASGKLKELVEEAPEVVEQVEEVKEEKVEEKPQEKVEEKE